MKIFFDTNVLLDVALRREPHFSRSNAILADAIENHHCYLSWHSISNIAYIAGRFIGEKDALIFIQKITAVCSVAPIDHKDLKVAFDHNHGDFEDAMQIAAAISADAEVIVTRDPKGFRKSPIPLVNPTDQL